MNDKLIDELRTQYNEMAEEPKITGAGYWAEHPETGIVSPETNTITMVASNRTLLTFHPDGRVDGDVADASEAARVFCETVSHLLGKTTPQPDASALVEALRLASGRLRWVSSANPGAGCENGRALAASWADDAAAALTAWEAQHG